MVGHLGAADVYEAYAIEQALFLVAKGKNPTTGWKNWFEPLKNPTEFSFNQRPPTGPAGQIILPFIVINGFLSPENQTVTIEEERNGTISNKTINVAHILDPLHLAALGAFIPSHLAGPKRTAGQNSTVQWHLGGFDIPFGCASWSHPTRSKHIDVYLEVTVAGVQDVSSAVSSCIGAAAVATALAALLTPIGWAAGANIFIDALTACLSTKLSNILTVRVFSTEHCN